MTAGDAPFVCCDPDVLAEALLRLEREDAVAVPTLAPGARSELEQSAEMLSFRAARACVGKPGREVTQDFEIADAVPPTGPLDRTARELEAAVNAALSRLKRPPFDAIAFNDRVVQRYPPTAAGISPHRDHVKYVKLVANLAIRGEGRFYICPERSWRGARAIPSAPGDAILMRGPGYRSPVDGDERPRPFHAVGRVDTERLVLGVREDSHTA